jgi:hypothetical protein
MKKILLTGSLLLLSGIMAMAQTITATDFTVNDCSGTSHHLYAELDAGKVIVVAFVMPCGMCSSPSLSAYNTVQSYATSNPGRVVFYLADDVGNTSCNSLNNWASNSGMGNATKFSSSSVNMGDYGNPGMPKIIVLGGPDHTVYYNQNDGVNTTDLKAAIVQGINATAGITENAIVKSKTTIFPNPVTANALVSYSLTKSNDVNLDIYNLLGEKIKAITVEKQTTGKHDVEINVESFESGVYFIKLNTGEASETIRFTVAH